MEPNCSSTPVTDASADAADAPADLPPTGFFASRLAGLLVAGPCLTMLVIALTLQPRNVGYGTAERLGLPACSVLIGTGYPCPTCGMTTSVSAAVRGQVSASWRAHPFGLVLTAGAALLALAGLVQMVTGRALLRTLRLGWWWVAATVVGVLIGWWWMWQAGVAAGKWPIG